MRKTLLLLTTMALALLLAAGVALAQATTQHINQTLPVDFAVDDQECSGELIHFTGQLHAVFHITNDAAGGIHAAAQFTFADVKGIGEVSGGEYRLPTTATSTFHTNSEGFPIIATEHSTSNVIGQGQLPDSKAHLLIHFTINENETVTAEVVQARFECSEGSQ